MLKEIGRDVGEESWDVCPPHLIDGDSIFAEVAVKNVSR